MSISGKFISAKIAGTVITGVQSWTADDSSEELDATTAADAGYKHPDFGLTSLSVSMDLIIDITTGVLVYISNGTVITDLQLFADTTATTPIYNVPIFYVFKSAPKGEINGRFTFSVQGKSVGIYFVADPN